MLHILEKSIQLVGVRGMVRLYRIPEEFIQHVVEDNESGIDIEIAEKLNLGKLYKYVQKYIYNDYDFV